MLEKLMMKLAKKTLKNELIIAASGIIDNFLNDESSKEQHSSSRYFNKHGEKAKQDFRQHIMDMILEIAEDDNPIYALRRHLVSSSKLSITNRLLFDDQFVEKREALYDALNKKSPEVAYNDEICSNLYMWTEAECIVLRMIQIGFLERTAFEKMDKDDDWWGAYIKVFENNLRLLYLLQLELIDGKKYLSPVERVLLERMKPAIDQMEKVWIGEIEPPKD